MFHPESRGLSPLSIDNNSVFHRVLATLKEHLLNVMQNRLYEMKHDKIDDKLEYCTNL